MIRILVTGSRKWNNYDKIKEALVPHIEGPDFLETFLIHGDCPTGADFGADYLWVAAGGEDRVERFPADWKKYGYAAGPIRNRQMVDSGIDLCYAFPLPDSKGTVDCMAYARSKDVKVIVMEAE